MSNVIQEEKPTIETELVLVEAISQFRIRYLVEVPVGKKEYALDTVTCEEAFEFGQEHIGETIVSHRIVKKEDLLEIALEDNKFATQELVDKSITRWVE
jgi:hypothetical protein